MEKLREFLKWKYTDSRSIGKQVDLHQSLDNLAKLNFESAKDLNTIQQHTEIFYSTKKWQIKTLQEKGRWEHEVLPEINPL